MALSSAQKQRRYRERHLGKDGEKVRLQAFISFQTEARLQRLARHHGYSITALIEKIADDADNAVLAGCRKMRCAPIWRGRSRRMTPAQKSPPGARPGGLITLAAIV